MPYKFRQSQVLAPSRKMIPELVCARDRLRAQLADMSSTGRGLSQSECYRTLVQLEALVNDGHRCSREQCEQLGRRLAQILDGSRSNILSVNDVKTIRRIIRPFTRSNPLVKRNNGNQATRTNRARSTAAEESAFVALPPIASATERETPPSDSQAAPDSHRAPFRPTIPARKPRKPSEWDSVILRKDEEDLRKVEAEKELARRKKQKYRDEVFAQRAELEEQRRVANERRRQDNKTMQAKVSAARAAEVAEAESRKKKADQLRKWNEEGLAERKRILAEEEREAKTIEERLVEKSRQDTALAKEEENRKRAQMQDNLQKAAALNARRNVLRAEEDQHRHAEEKRIALAAQEMVEKREREREEYLESQRSRIAKMMSMGSAAVEQTEQRVQNDYARAERLAAEQELLEKRREEEKTRRRAELNREMQDQLDAQVAAKKAAKKAEQQAERDFRRAETERVRKLNEEDAAVRAAKRLVEVETQQVVLNQIRSKYGVDEVVEAPAPAPPKVGRASAQIKEQGRRASRENAVLRTRSKLAAGSPDDKFKRPPPGVRPQRN